MLAKIWEIINLKPVKLLVTSVVALLGIYGTFLWERKAEITFEVLADSSVLDVRESLSNLVITYGGTNLKEHNQSLYLVTVRVVNNGNADVLKSSYDPEEPLGIRLSTGDIVESPSVTGESYFANNVRPVVKDGKMIVFSPVILNAGDSFQIKALVLSRAGEVPQVFSTGKIAGIQHIKVTRPYLELGAPSYWTMVFSGGLLVQAGRLLYILIGMVAIALTILVVGVPIAFIGNSIGRSLRRKKVEGFRLTLARAATLKEEYLINQFIDDTTAFQRFKQFLLGIADPPLPPGLEERELRMIYEGAENSLINAGLIMRDGPQILIDPEIEATARAFVAYVSSRRNAIEE